MEKTHKAESNLNYINNFFYEDANWSQIRTKTVNCLHDEWKSKKDSEYLVFKDTKLEDGKLAMLKLKELENLIRTNKKLLEENECLNDKISKHKTALNVIRDFIKFKDLEKNRDVMEKILELV